jgi:drug/metabolite transporter (DMT)-like permease
MQRSELIGVLINLGLPFAGLLTFMWVRYEMRAAQIEQPPTVSLFILFATYGGLLVMVLTMFFWYWSGMATLGFLYLVFVAPIVTIILAVILYRQRRLSRYHFISFIGSAVCPGVIGVLVLVYAVLGFVYASASH